MNHHNVSSSSSSSFLNRAFITISLMLLLLRFAPFATGQKICSTASPNNPHTYFKHVKTVLQRLVDGTPNASPTFGHLSRTMIEDPSRGMQRVTR
ncbi:hypothetical protein LINPERPRIM_LOCUS31997 [Linum perenne]